MSSDEFHVLSKIIPDIMSIINSNNHNDQQVTNINIKQNVGTITTATAAATASSAQDDNSLSAASTTSMSSNVTPSSSAAAASTHEERRHIGTAMNFQNGKRGKKHAKQNSTTATDNGGFKEQSEGLKFVLKRFIQIVCNYCPLVIVADDIQWADQASLDLLESWMMDSNNTSLMVVGCYRSNVVHGDSGGNDVNGTTNTIHPVQRVITSLESSKRDRCFRISQIEVGNLSHDDIIELLAKTLAIPTSSSSASTSAPTDVQHGTTTGQDIPGLASIVADKTSGNPFFIQQYLQSLVQHRLLNFDTATMQWIWDTAEITNKSPATTSIGEMMTHKLKESDYARYVLPVAACIGATFSKTTVSGLIRALSIHSDHSTFFRALFETEMSTRMYLDASNINSAFHNCQKEGFIVVAATRNNKNEDDPKGQSARMTTKKKRRPKRGSEDSRQDQYSFAHDKVQEAALALIPQDKLSELRYRVGEVLLSVFSKDELEAKMFTVASLLNSRLDLVPSQQHKAERRKRIVSLNYKAGVKAMTCSAFASALAYLQTAMKLLPPDHWHTDFQLSMDIYSTAAECASIIPKTELMHKYCTTIIHLDCPVLKKMRAYHILMDASSVQVTNNPVKNPVKLGFDVLSQLECKFPKTNGGRTFNILTNLIKIKMQSSKWTKETFLELPISKSATDAATTKMLDKFSTELYFADPDILPMGILKNFHLTQKRGLTAYSPPAFAAMGLIFAALFGDYKTAEMLGEVAIEMLDRLDMQAPESRTKLVTYCTVFHWMKPMRSITKEFPHVYQTGMATGDVETAMHILLFGFEMSFISGEQVNVAAERALSNSKIMKDMQKKNFYDMMDMYWEAMRNLQGVSMHTTTIVGESFDEAAILTNETKGKNEMFLKLTTLGVKVVLASIFSEYQTGADILTDQFDVAMKQLLGHCRVYLWTSFGGICCYAAAHQQSSKRHKYLKVARKCRKLLKQWSSQGNPNCPHMVKMLDAEEYWYRGKTTKAITTYHHAVELSKENKFTQYQALANERLGMLLYECNGGRDSSAAILCFNEALQLYEEWGATKKVEQLQAQLRHTYL